MEDPCTGLIRRAQGGDKGSFSELLDLHYATIYRIAWKWCGDRTNAKDIAQQSCIKLVRSLSHYRFQAAFATWLYQLVINCARDWQRAQQRHEHDALPEDDATADGSGTSEDYIYVVQLLDRLEKVGAGMKETAILVHAEGLSHAEAAEILGVSESTISWRIHAMRKYLNEAEATTRGDV